VIKSFEDLLIWKKGIELSKAIYTLTNSGELLKDFGLRDQMRRAAVSIPSNIAEGFERKGNKEFNQFLYIALGSLAELQTQIIICYELDYINQQSIESITNLIIEIRKMIASLQNTMKLSEFKGQKYK